MTDLTPLPRAAAELGLASSTLRHQVRLGRLHGLKLGRDWYFTRGEIDRYRREHLRPTGPREAA